MQSDAYSDFIDSQAHTMLHNMRYSPALQLVFQVW